MLPAFRQFSLAALVQCLTLCTSYAAEQSCLKFIAPDIIFYEKFIPSIQRSFKAAGLCFTAFYVEATRAPLILQKGEVDGELVRVPDYLSVVGDQIVMVPEPIVEGYGMLVARSNDQLSLDQITGGDIAVGIGAVWHDMLKLPENRLIYLESYESALQMLEKGRVSAVLIDNINFRGLRNPNEEFFTKRLTPKTAAHLFVHKRHENKLQKFNAAILKWKSDQTSDDDAS